MKKINAFNKVKFCTLLNYTKSFAMLAVLNSLQSQTSYVFLKNIDKDGGLCDQSYVLCSPNTWNQLILSFNGLFVPIVQISTSAPSLTMAVPSCVITRWEVTIVTVWRATGWKETTKHAWVSSANFRRVSLSPICTWILFEYSDHEFFQFSQENNCVYAIS